MHKRTPVILRRATCMCGKETFKFNNQELVASSCVKSKKKKSPCQLRREDRRREARKSKITEEVVEIHPVITPQSHTAAEKTAVPKQSSTVLAFKCEQCEYASTSEKGLKQHVRMKHSTSQVVEEAEDSFRASPTCPGQPTYSPCGCT